MIWNFHPCVALPFSRMGATGFKYVDLTQQLRFVTGVNTINDSTDVLDVSSDKKFHML